MELEIGTVDGDSWRALATFEGPVSKSSLQDWAQGSGPTAGTYQVRAPGTARPSHLIRIGPGGAVDTVEVLDID